MDTQSVVDQIVPNRLPEGESSPPSSVLKKKETVSVEGTGHSPESCGATPTRPAPLAPKESLLLKKPPVKQETDDLEALGRTQSGPVYSVFSKRKKQCIVLMTAWAGFFSPLSASIYFPALTTLAKDLKVSDELITLTLTSYMIFQGLAPTVFGDLADITGRRPAYFVGFIVYIGANLGLALQNNYVALFLLRCLQSTGSSGTIALGNGVVADISSSAERGIYMGLATSGPMIGPAVGPILGGVLSEYLGWRAIFWFLTIMAGAYLIPFLIIFPETSRNVVGNGSIPPQAWNMSLLNYLTSRKTSRTENQTNPASSMESQQLTQAVLARKRRFRWPNPLKTIHIILEKDVGIILFYNSLVYIAFYDVISSLPTLFADIYGFNDFQIGLCFIPYGVSCSLAAIICGRLMDMNYRRIAKQAGFTVDRKRGDDLRNFPIEKARIQVILPQLYVGIIATLCYGWVLEIEAPLAAPLVLQFVLGFCLTGSFNVISLMLIDFYPSSPATATAANNLVRCLMGAGGTAVIIQMIDGMGRGWCFTFIAAVIFFTSPLLWVVLKWGPQWREERAVRETKKREKENARHESESEHAES